MGMTSKLAGVLFLGSMMLLRADQMIEGVQQTLKEQGFYYGEITGEMNANLTAAIRRYQIRNGLQVTGELNAETMRSLGMGSASSTPSVAKSSPSPSPEAPKRDEQSSDTANALQDRQVYPVNPGPSGTASSGGPLAGTPYESSPSEVQRNLVMSAQIALARRGLFRETIDGIYGPAMEFSLRAYQARTGLPVTGRLDLGTLAALRLLPGPRGPVYDPSRHRFRPPPGPPVRGEWVPE